jgi:DNA-binding NtrC family response regulator
MNERVLVVEHDPLILKRICGELSANGFEPVKANNLSESFLKIAQSSPKIILADSELQDGTAFDLLAWLKAREFNIPLIVLTGHASIDLAVDAVKHGAEHFIPMPVDIPFLVSVMRRALENVSNRNKTLANRLDRARYERDPFLGLSPAIQELKRAAKRVAKANCTVLIQGETGTGKGVLARWLHKIGPRSGEAFVDLNCAGLSHDLLESELFGHQKGAFTGATLSKVGFLEAADRGTLFLDEIGDMHPNVQPKILKVVEEKQFYRLGDVNERKVDVQIIAATHRDLNKLTEKGEFRSDLYFRISTLQLRVPPLRERLEDIPIITNMFLDQFAWDMKRGPLRITDDARSALQRYTWPGNVRELRNVLERASLLSDDGVINSRNLALEVSNRLHSEANATAANLTLKEMEKRYILQTLDSEGGSVIQAAKRLGIPRSSLYAKIKTFGG